MKISGNPKNYGYADSILKKYDRQELEVIEEQKEEMLRKESGNED